MTRYIHKWHTPIKIKLFGVDEFVYHAPWYNPRLLPVMLCPLCYQPNGEHYLACTQTYPPDDSLIDELLPYPKRRMS